MYPWMNPWFYAFKAPWSGDVDQTINPVTSWFSPDVEFNFAGNKSIEAAVISEVASYGKQLGILTDAVMELAAGKQGEAMMNLHKLAAEIESVKKKHKTELSDKAHRLLSELKQTDPELLKQVINEYKK